MNPTKSCFSIHEGSFYFYECTPNEKDNEILVTVSKYFYWVLALKEDFSVPKSKILQSKCKKITAKTCVTRDLYYLTKYNYIPELRNDEIIFIKKSLLTTLKTFSFCRYFLDLSYLFKSCSQPYQLQRLALAAMHRDARAIQMTSDSTSSTTSDAIPVSPKPSTPTISAPQPSVRTPISAQKVDVQQPQAPEKKSVDTNVPKPSVPPVASIFTNASVPTSTPQPSVPPVTSSSTNATVPTKSMPQPTVPPVTSSSTNATVPPTSVPQPTVPPVTSSSTNATVPPTSVPQPTVPPVASSLATPSVPTSMPQPTVPAENTGFSKPCVSSEDMKPTAPATDTRLPKPNMADNQVKLDIPVITPAAQETPSTVLPNDSCSSLPTSTAGAIPTLASPIIPDSTSTNVSTETSETVLEFEFPSADLEIILRFCEKIELDSFLKDIQTASTQKNISSQIQWLASWVCDFNTPLGKLIENNCTAKILRVLLKNTLSIGATNCFQFFMCNRDDINELKKAGKLGEIYISVLKLSRYLENFYTAKNDLDANKLILSILQDKNLHELLKNKGEVVDQLARLATSLKITGIETRVIRQFIEAFMDIQALIIQHPKQERIRKLEKVFKIIIKDVEKFEDRVSVLCGLIRDFIPLLQVFFAPNPLPIKLLLEANKNETSIFVNANRKIEYYDCTKTFEEYRDELLGPIGHLVVSTPLQNQINKKILGHRFFGSSDNLENKSFAPRFDHLSFEQFSFKDASFSNFTFSNTCLRQCDFTDVKFSGKIAFHNVYMDQMTADSILASIAKALSDHRVQLTVCGIENVFLVTKSATSPRINVDALKPYHKHIPVNIPIVNLQPLRNEEEDFSFGIGGLAEKRKPPVIIPTGPLGFTNVGNSCYINASLQVIFNIPPICDAIKNNFFLPPVKGEEKKRAVVNCLYDLLENKYRSDTIEQETQLKNLRLAAYQTDRLKGYLNDQQDANEFMQLILETLNWAPIFTKDFASIQIKGIEESEPLGGVLKPNGGDVYLIPNSMLSLTLEKKAYFTEIIKENFLELKNESREINGKSCSQWNRVTKIENTPDYIIMHLARFKTLETKQGAFVIEKITTAITFPEYLSLSCKSDKGDFQNVNYQIVSYLNHQGPTPYEGHYEAYIRNEKDDEWCWCSDNRVRPKAKLGNNVPSEAYIITLKKMT